MFTFVGTTFGSPTPAFGLQQQQPGSIFGGQTTGFNTGTSLFGNSAVSTAQPTMFGSASTTPAFGQQGIATASSTSTFGRPQGSLFGTSTAPATSFGTGTFGANTTPTFGASTSAPVGTTIKFQPVVGSDSIMRNGQSQNVNTRHICITAMKEYESKSLEELRMEDYAANRKGPQAGSAFGTTGAPALSFGSPATPALTSGTSAFGAPSTGLFGNQQNKPTFGAALNQTPSSTSLFGNAANTFGKPPAFGATTSTSNSLFSSIQPQASQSNLFGTTSTASTFGQTTTGLFGQNTTANTAAKPFAFTNPTTQPQTSSIFGQPNQLAGGFNAVNQQKSLFGGTSTGFGPTSLGGTTTNFPSFGVSTTTTTPATQSIFGTQPLTFGANTAAKPTFSFGTPQNTFGATLGQTSTTGLGGATGTSLFGTMPGASTGTFGSVGLFNTSTLGSGTTGSSLFPSLQSNQNTFSTGLTGGSVTNPPSNTNTSPSNQLLLTMLQTLPYGTSPLFQNDLNSSSSSSTTAQFTTDARTINQYKMNVKTQLIRRVKVSNKSGVLFDQIEDEELEGRMTTGDMFMPKKNVKKLVLKPKGGSITNSPAISNVDSPRFEASSVAMSTPASSNRHHHQSLSEQPDSTVLELVRQPSSNLLHDSTTKGLDLSIESIPSNQGETSLSPTKDASVPALKCGLILSRSDYYTIPPLDEIDSYYNESSGTCILDSFTIGRKGYGSIFWEGPIDVASLNLDEIVHIRRKEVIVYPDEDDDHKPPVGRALNRPAQITLDKVWPIDKKTSEIIKDIERLEAMNYAARLENATVKLKATFKDYRPDTGSWVFCVKHFSKYGLVDDDDEDMEVVTVPTSKSTRQEPIQPTSTEKQQTLSKETSILKLDSSSMDTTLVKPITAFTTSFEQMFNDFPKPEDYVYKGPSRSPITLSQSKLQQQQFMDTFDFPSLSKSSFLTQDYCMRSVLFDEGVEEPLTQPSKKTRSTLPQSRFLYDPSFNSLDMSQGSDRQTTTFITAPTSLPQIISITRQKLPFKMNSFPWRQKVIADISSVKFSPSAKVHFFGGSSQFITYHDRNVSTYAIDEGVEESEFLGECLHEQIQNNTQVRTHSTYMPFLSVKPKCVNNFWNKELNQLVIALYGDLTTASEYEQIQERKNALIDWLCARNKRIKMPTHPIERIIYHLCTNDIKSAIDEALKSKQPRLAILIATSTSPLAKEDLANQLTSWFTSGAEAFIDGPILSLYAILAGILDITSAENDSELVVNPLAGLDWGQQLAIRLLYQSNGRMEDCIASIVTQTKLVSYHLIAQYRRNPWLALDYCESLLDAWLLHQSLSSYGIIAKDARSDALHAAFAAQLVASHIRWASFIALHIADDTLRSRVIHEVLSLSGPGLSPQESKWLQEYLVIPTTELAMSRAQFSQSTFDYLSSCQSLIDAGRWAQAHDLLLEHIFPDLVINEELKILGLFLSKLRPQRPLIPTWYSSGAHIYDVYHALVTNSENIAELWPIPVNVLSMKCPTPKHAFAQSEMAQQIERRLILETNGRLNPGLPLPDDYALMQLRLNGLQTLEDLSALY